MITSLNGRPRMIEYAMLDCAVAAALGRLQ